jgi:hypothetical protein
MAKSKISKKGELTFDKDKAQEEEEIVLDPATIVDLERFDNVEEYWKAMEELQKAAKKKKEDEKKKKAKEILNKEETIENKDPEKMTTVEKFYWQISQPPSEPLMPSKSYLKDRASN